MSALINLSGARVERYVNLTVGPKAEIVPLLGQGMALRGGAIESLLTKEKEKGKALEKEAEISQTTLLPDTVVKIVLGKIIPVKFETLLSIHPKLNDVAFVSYTTIYSPGYEYELAITVKPFKKLELSELPWLVSLFVID